MGTVEPVVKMMTSDNILKIPVDQLLVFVDGVLIGNCKSIDFDRNLVICKHFNSDGNLESVYGNIELGVDMKLVSL